VCLYDFVIPINQLPPMLKETTMIKQTLTLIFGLTLIFNQATGQTFKKQFNELVSKKDTVEQKKLLEKWEKTDNNDLELFVAYFNYYVNKRSRKNYFT
jgi:hypothetical protein